MVIIVGCVLGLTQDVDADGLRDSFFGTGWKMTTAKAWLTIGMVGLLGLMLFKRAYNNSVRHKWGQIASQPDVEYAMADNSLWNDTQFKYWYDWDTTVRDRMNTFIHNGNLYIIPSYHVKKSSPEQIEQRKQSIIENNKVVPFAEKEENDFRAVIVNEDIGEEL